MRRKRWDNNKIVLRKRWGTSRERWDNPPTSNRWDNNKIGQRKRWGIWTNSKKRWCVATIEKAKKDMNIEMQDIEMLKGMTNVLYNTRNHFAFGLEN